MNGTKRVMTVVLYVLVWLVYVATVFVTVAVWVLGEAAIVKIVLAGGLIILSILMILLHTQR